MTEKWQDILGKYLDSYPKPSNLISIAKCGPAMGAYPHELHLIRNHMQEILDQCFLIKDDCLGRIPEGRPSTKDWEHPIPVKGMEHAPDAKKRAALRAKRIKCK